MLVPIFAEILGASTAGMPIMFSQGIEAQTLANTYLAIENDLEVMPVVNKIDLPSADPERVCNEVENIIGMNPL